MKDNSESRPSKATPSKGSCERLQKSLENKVMESFLGVQSSHSKDRPKDKQPSQPNRRDGQSQKFVNVSHNQALVPRRRRPRIRDPCPELKTIRSVILENIRNRRCRGSCHKPSGSRREQLRRLFGNFAHEEVGLGQGVRSAFGQPWVGPKAGPG